MKQLKLNPAISRVGFDSHPIDVRSDFSFFKRNTFDVTINKVFVKTRVQDALKLTYVHHEARTRKFLAACRVAVREDFRST